MSDTVSPEQLAANRANASRSTGPRTPEGKHRSAQNARKHGFTASSFAVGVPSGPLEDLQEVAHLRDDLISVYRPVNSQELFALERVALAQQAILRAARLESGFFTTCLNESFDTNGESTLPTNSELAVDIEITRAQNRNYVLGNGFHRLVRQSNRFALLLRYQAQAERQYRRAIEEFERLKALREELRNEANPAETETNETTCTPCETNPIPPGDPAPAPPAPAPGPQPPTPGPRLPTPGPRPTTPDSRPLPAPGPQPLAPDSRPPTPDPRPPALAGPPSEACYTDISMLRVRFAPSPTGFLHIGSARTFIFNWLYARHHGGVMILRIDDTDVERNTEASLTSIFEGLRWLDLGWDEEYKQSERLALHREMAEAIFHKGFAYRDFTPAQSGETDRSGAEGAWLCNSGMRDLPARESGRRASSGEPFALRFRVPRDAGRQVRFADAVYGPQSKSTADIEDFALLRSDGMPTYHLATCADDAALRISHVIRGQDHLTNTFKHVLIFEAAGVAAPQFAHLPLLVAPDGTKLSKRRHGPVVSVTTYRDAGFLPHAFVNFLCLLGWSPKDDRQQMSRQEIVDAFSLEGINRPNAVVNFTEDDPFDPKAVWLNAEHIRALPVEDLAERLLPIVRAAGFPVDRPRMLAITPLVRERMKLLRDVLTVADFFFAEDLPPYETSELIPKKGDPALALAVLEHAAQTLAAAEFSHDGLEAALRSAAQTLGIKAGQLFEPVRVAVCGRKTAPPLFRTLEVLGRGTCLRRVDQAIAKLKDL